MEYDQPDSVVVSVKKMLQELTPVAPECSIYRVSRRLVHINPKAYTPQVISIGPLHRGREDLMGMEPHKLWCVQSFLRRTNLTVEAAVAKVRSWEKRARNCYAESINMSSDEFVMMILVDGCSLVELMIKYSNQFPRSGDEALLDHFFLLPLGVDLFRDLIMLENQLPFFLLQGLFHLYSSFSKSISFEQVAHHFFNNGLIKPSASPQDLSRQKVRHLVDFLTLYYIPSTPVIQEKSGSGDLRTPPTATELHEIGVVFKKAAGDKRIVDISFKDGVLEIPPFAIHDATETHLRNMIAFEHYLDVRNENVIPYVAFLDGLISTEMDVDLLVEAKIITNHMGSNECVSRLINDLIKEVSISGNDYFNSLSSALHEHGRRRWNRWMASLRRDYFNTPWAVVSFFAAAFLILLTLLQTVFSALSLSK